MSISLTRLSDAMSRRPNKRAANNCRKQNQIAYRTRRGREASKTTRPSPWNNSYDHYRFFFLSLRLTLIPLSLSAAVLPTRFKPYLLQSERGEEGGRIGRGVLTEAACGDHATPSRETWSDLLRYRAARMQMTGVSMAQGVGSRANSVMQAPNRVL